MSSANDLLESADRLSRRAWPRLAQHESHSWVPGAGTNRAAPVETLEDTLARYGREGILWVSYWPRRHAPPGA